MAVVTVLGGCGPDDVTTPDPSAVGSGAGSPAVGGGAAGGGGGSSATGGSAGSGNNAGGPPSAACSGSFGPGAPVLLEDEGFNINGISLPADELELYYARGVIAEPLTPPQVVRRVRASTSEQFGPVEVLPGFETVCGDKIRVNPDVSEDGLTLYVTCTADAELGTSEGMSPLRVARRADRSAAFVLDPEPIGSVFASAGISADQLTAYTDGEVFETAPQMFTRASTTESFGGPGPVPGVTTPLRSLDVSADGLLLFGAARNASVTDVFLARRASQTAPFGAPQRVDLQLAAAAVGAPNITAGCSLYVVAILHDQPRQTVHLARGL